MGTKQNLVPNRARLDSRLRALGVGLAAATAAVAARGLLGLVSPGVEARFSVLFPAALVATLAAGPRAGGGAALAGLAAGEFIFGKPPLMNLADALSIATAVVSLLAVVWLAERHHRLIAWRGQQREELMRRQFQLYERSHGFMFVLGGSELRYEFANPTYLRLIDQEHVVGKRLVEVTPDIEREFLDMYAAIRRTGQPFAGRCESRAGGKLSYVEIVAEPLFAGDGSVEAIFVEGYDVTDKVEAEGRLKLVAQEVDHRANNLLAVVQSIVRLSKGETAEGLQRNIVGRVDALARAHQLLADARWRGGDLQRLVAEELLPYTLGEPGRSRLQGPLMELSPGEAQALAMGIHELATNAAKYGALSTPAGRIEVTWDHDGAGARHICWREDGGPPVTPPSHKGFGANVLERTLRGVGGRTRLQWRPEGLVCDFDLPPPQPGSAGPTGVRTGL